MQSGGGKALLAAVTSLLLLGLLLSGAAAQITGEIQWESIGPTGVSILALVPHPTDPLTLYAVVDAHGVYKSTDGGETWQAKNQGMEGLTVLSLCIADETGQALYAGTLGSGVVFKSGDGGETWEPAGGIEFGIPAVESQPPLWGVLSLAAVNETVLYAGTGGAGIYKSEDGGESWYALNEGLGSPPGLDVDVNAILPDPWHEGVIFIGANRGIFKSEDNGGSWQQKFPSITGALIFADDGKTIYAGSIEGLLCSKDAGEHWEVMRQARRDGLLEVKALLVDGASLYVGTSGGLYETSDSRHWKNRNGNLPLDGLVVGGIAKRGKWLYIGTGWGIFRSEDNGASWIQLSHSLPEKGLIVKRITFGNDKENNLYIGTWGGGIYKSTDRGTTWSEVNHGLGAPYITELTTSNGMLYAATWRAFYMSDDAGETWDFFAGPIYSERFVVPRLPGSEIYALIRQWEKDSDNKWKNIGRLLKSDDGGSNWQAVESLTVSDVTDVLVNPENDQIMYVATREDGIYQSVDGGNQWSELDQESTVQGILTLALGGEAGNTLFAGTPIGIYRREPDGTWERTILGFYDTVVTDPSHPNRVYAVTSEEALIFSGDYGGGALIFSEDYGRTWKSAGFAKVGINDLAVDPNGNFIYAATEGQSVLRGSVKGLFPGSLNLTFLVIGLSGLLGATLVAGFFSLARSSGLPPGVLLRQRLALIRVGLGYRDYRQRWEIGTPLERLITLLIPDDEPLDSEQLGRKLAALYALVDPEQLDVELSSAVRDGLLLRQEGGYLLAEPSLARALQAHEGRNGQMALVEQIRRDHPLSVEARRFLVQAGFAVQPVDPFGLFCTANLPLWSDVSPLYVRLVLGQALDIREFQYLCAAAEVAYGRDLRDHMAAVVIDRPPRTGDLHQIFALRAQRGLTVVPLPRSLMIRARLDGREMEALREQVDLYIGRTDLYDARAAVTDVLSFFGRSGLLADLERRLTAGQSAVVFGVRKVGKSSLLGRLREECPWSVAMVDLQGYPGGLGYIYGEALRGWRAALRAAFLDLPVPEWTDDLSAPGPAAQAQTFRQMVVSLLDLLADQPGRPGLLLFLDEIDVLFDQPEYPKFAAILRSVAEDHRCQGRFALLGAGLEPALNRLDRMGGRRNPLYTFFSEVRLGPLEPEDARTMIVSIGGQMGIGYENEALDILMEAGGGHPFLTRQLCSQAVRDLERPGMVDRAQAAQAVEDYLRRPRNYLAESLWGVDHGGPRPAEAALLRSLAATQPQPEESLLPTDLSPEKRRLRHLALDHLRDQSMIHRAEGGWELTIPLYRRWIRRYILNLPAGSSTERDR